MAVGVAAAAVAACGRGDRDGGRSHAILLPLQQRRRRLPPPATAASSSSRNVSVPGASAILAHLLVGFVLFHAPTTAVAAAASQYVIYATPPITATMDVAATPPTLTMSYTVDAATNVPDLYRQYYYDVAASNSACAANAVKAGIEPGTITAGTPATNRLDFGGTVTNLALAMDPAVGGGGAVTTRTIRFCHRTQSYSQSSSSSSAVLMYQRDTIVTVSIVLNGTIAMSSSVQTVQASVPIDTRTGSAGTVSAVKVTGPTAPVKVGEVIHIKLESTNPDNFGILFILSVNVNRIALNTPGPGLQTVLSTANVWQGLRNKWPGIYQHTCTSDGNLCDITMTLPFSYFTANGYITVTGTVSTAPRRRNLQLSNDEYSSNSSSDSNNNSTMVGAQDNQALFELLIPLEHPVGASSSAAALIADGHRGSFFCLSGTTMMIGAVLMMVMMIG
jgi:hypothetical protein